MSSVGAWILSILGIVVIGAVIDLVLPSGRMNKYVKSIFSAVTILVIILPLPNLVKNGCGKYQKEFIDKRAESGFEKRRDRNRRNRNIGKFFDRCARNFVGKNKFEPSSHCGTLRAYK